MENDQPGQGLAWIFGLHELIGGHGLSFGSEVGVVDKVEPQVARFSRASCRFLRQGEEPPGCSVRGPVLGVVDLSTQDASACDDERVV